MVITSRDRYEGCLLGLAVGDALGGPTEFLSYEQIRIRWPPDGVTSFMSFRDLPPGSFTDDTEMSIAVARGLTRSQDLSSESILSSIAYEFVEWAKKTRPARSPGLTCMQGVHQLATGVHWSQSGDNDSKGCGSAMRSAPIGLAYPHALDALRFYASKVSLMTHGSPVATAGSVATAYLVARSLDGIPVMNLLPDLVSFTMPISLEFAGHVQKVIHLTMTSSVRQAHRELGDGWTAEEAVAGAAYANTLHPQSFRDIVLEAANSGGDCDSKACIAGAIAGARLGVQAIPAEWREEVEGRDDLIVLAGELLLLQSRLAQL
ncbi:MAG: ADP-ribosylglycohydrolase family protein [Candidatus Thorarchaeota archaeon]|nr:ADP-ribosylglycohydrolase family protein [Candidatus Thorarchaeota archaeon]